LTREPYYPAPVTASRLAEIVARCWHVLKDATRATPGNERDAMDLLDLAREVGASRGGRPRITCFCGSSRFIDQMAVLMWEYEKAGRISLGLHLLPGHYVRGVADHLAEAQGVAAHMDALHLRKIDLADEVVVVNVGGYVGDSTRREIEYARARGKPVRYLEVPPDAA